jgi:SAM-dependent methyltransferase
VTVSFYDSLAPFYHLLYADWDAAISRQGHALAALLQRARVKPGELVLDAACGIGTQSLGLLKLGYRVEASDISRAAVDRLKTEASARNLHLSARVDDLRSLSHTTTGSVSAVIACDNSIPHLLSDAEILQAFRSCYRCLRPGGAAVFSVRDYAAIERKTPEILPYGLRYLADRRFLAVQVWEWDGPDHYDLSMYLISEFPDGTCETRVLKSRYYAISIERLSELLVEAGFADVQRDDDALFQPVVQGRRVA